MMQTSSNPGSIELLSVEGAHPIRYFVWVHPDARPGSPWLCAVHGIARNAAEQVELLCGAAARRGYSIVAPLFDEQHYPAYQRLGVDKGLRSDSALLGIADALTARYGAPHALDCFGFSGGAQFVHRLALVAPERVRRLAVAAAGWFTLPDPERRFPYGIKPDPRFAGPLIDITAFAAIPQLVLVGAADRVRDAALRKRRHLDKEQGRTRFERSVNWHRAIRALALRHGHAPDNHRLVVMPGVSHDFSAAVERGALDEHVLRFFSADEGA